MNPRIYNAIANLSLIGAVLSTFLWDKAPVFAVSTAVVAGVTSMCVYFFNRAHSADWESVKKEESEPIVPEVRNTPNEQAAQIEATLIDAVKTMTESIDIEWKINQFYVSTKMPARSLIELSAADVITKLDYSLRNTKTANDLLDFSRRKVFDLSAWDDLEKDEPQTNATEELPFLRRAS